MTRLQFRDLARFRHVIREFLRFSESAAAAVGLTPPQHQALLAVRGAAAEAPLTVGDLAATLLVRHHSAVGLVDRLCALGLMRRRRGARDRRQVLLTLTPAGRRLLARLTAAHRDELLEMAPRLRAVLRAVEGRPAARAGPTRTAYDGDVSPEAGS